ARQGQAEPQLDLFAICSEIQGLQREGEDTGDAGINITIIYTIYTIRLANLRGLGEGYAQPNS
ncbi:MAG: hypothetical protein ACREIC_26885, partial [Limisphaerales bacterium]